MARLAQINEYKARQQQQPATGQTSGGIDLDAAKPEPITNPVAPSTDPLQMTSNQADNNERITYRNSGFVPNETTNAAYRREALGSMTEDEFLRNQPTMNASDKEYWREQYRLHPENAYTTLKYQMASDETYEERRKRERREHLGQVFSGLGNLIGAAANLYYTSQGAYPIDFDTPIREANERIERIKEKREALKAREDAILANARMDDIRAARNLAAAREKAKREQEEREREREHDLLKFNMNLEADNANRAADRELRQQQMNEAARHNRAQEAIGRTNAETRQENNKRKDNEVAYITKYGDVIFDNPKNKRAATLSTLEVMMNHAKGDVRDGLVQLLESARNGDVDSYNKAEMYVSQHLNSDAVALEHLYKQAKKYGRINADNTQREAREQAISRGRQNSVPPSRRQNNNNVPPSMR